MSALRVLSGSDAMRAAEDLRRQKAKESDWPYEHLFPPRNSIPVNGGTTGVQAANVPAAGGTAVIATFQVPSGFKFIMTGIWQCFNGVFVPGDSLWTLTVNPAGGAQANPVQGLIQVPVPLGSWVYGVPWLFERPYEFAPLDLLSDSAKNVNLSAGPPNQYVSGFFGYLLPSTSSR